MLVTIDKGFFVNLKMFPPKLQEVGGIRKVLKFKSIADWRLALLQDKRTDQLLLPK